MSTLTAELGFTQTHEGSSPSTRARGGGPLTLVLVCPAHKPNRFQEAIADLTLLFWPRSGQNNIGPALAGPGPGSDSPWWGLG